MDNKTVLETIVRSLEDKKGRDIKVLDISGISILSDYFILVSGSNKNQIDAMVDDILEKLHMIGVYPKNIEGRTSAWILMDFGDIIVHIFDEESRSFYDLERIWRDSKEIAVN
ncbi:MAG: ribosome silencing factor [Lachnospiraceae bacterium]|nr:ribosome silencing factor [Lachnospiraceae bacterium]